MATPPYDATWNAGDGNWSDALDWLEHDPITNQPENYVPGPDDSVNLPGDNGNPYTVTYSATDGVWSLDSGAGATLDLTGGSLTLDDASSLGGAVVIAAAASLVAADGAGAIDIGSITNKGTLTGDSGDTLDIEFGIAALGGTIDGAGELDFGAGAAVTITTPTITIDSIVINDGYEGGSVTLGVDLTYAGAFTFQNGTLDLNGHTLTLSNSSITLSGGGVFGPGTLKVTGETTIDGVSVGFNGAAATLEDAGSATQSSMFDLGGTVLIDSGATYTFDDATYISGGTTTNNGTIIDDSGGGNVNIYGAFTNNGTVTVDSGDTFDIASVTAALGGAIEGAGELDLDAGAAVTITTSKITVGSIVINDGYEGGSVTPDVDLTYAGAFAFQNGTLDLNGHTLTLSNSSITLSGGGVFGPGTLKVTGEATVEGLRVGFNGAAATLEDAGSITQSSMFDLGGMVLIDSGATYTLDDATYISGGTTTNNGTIVDDSGGGNVNIYGTFTNKGKVTVDSGDTFDVASVTAALGGTIEGAGELDLDAGAAVTITTSTITVGSIVINDGYEGGSVTPDVDLTYAGAFTFQNGTLDLNGHTLILSGSGNALSGGTIFGSGTLKMTGETTIDGVTVGLDGTPATLEDAGSVTQSSGWNLSGKLLIDAGASYTFADAVSIDNYGATIINDGTFTDAATGSSALGGALTNNGLLRVAAGSLTINNTTTNNGALDAAAGSLIIYGALAGNGIVEVGAAQSVEFHDTVASNQQITFQGATGTVVLDTPSTFAAAIARFETGNVIQLDGFQSTGHSFSGGVLTLTSNNGPISLDFGATNANVAFTIDVNTSLNETTITLASNEFIGGGYSVNLSGSLGDTVYLYSTAYDWDNVTGSNGTVYLTSAQATITGGGDAIYFAGGEGNATSLYGTGGNGDAVYGSFGTVYLTSAQASVVGAGDTIYFSGGSGNSANLFDTDSNSDTVYGSGGTVYLNGAQVNVVGGGDTIYFSDASGNVVALYDTSYDSDGVYGSGGTVYLNSAQTTVSGGGDAIYFASGAGNAVSLYGTGGDPDAVYGSFGTVYLTSAQASVIGAGDTIYFSGGSPNSANLSDTGGNSDTVYGSNGTVFLTGAQVSVVGGGDATFFSGGSGSSANLFDTGGAWDAVYGSGGSVALIGAQTSVWGGGDAISFSGGSGNSAALFDTGGVWDAVYGSGGSVALASAQTSVWGGGDTVYFSGGSQNIASLYDTNSVWDTVYGSNGTVALTGAQTSVIGAGNTIAFYATSNWVSASGASEAFVFQPAIGQDTINGFAASDSMTFSASDFANFAALSPHISQSGSNTLISLDANDTVTLTNTTASSLTSSQFHFV